MPGRMKTLIAAASLLALMFGWQTAQAQILKAFTEPYETIRVATAEPGRVGEAFVHLGDVVKQGDLILSLDNRVLEQTRKLAIAKANARGNLEFADTELKLKANRLEKLKSAQSDGFAGVNEIEIAQTELASAQARRQAALDEQTQNQLDVARIDAMIEQRQVRSPIDGVVIQLNHKTGENVSSNEPETAVVVDLSRLRAKFYLLTEQAEKLTEGQSINLRLPEDGKPVVGVIEYIAPVTSADSLTVQIDVVIDNRQNQIRSGVPIRIELE